MHASSWRSGLAFVVTMAWMAAAVAGSSEAAGERPAMPTDGRVPSDRSALPVGHEAARRAVVEDESGGLRAWNPGQRWITRFDGRGCTTSPQEGTWAGGLELLAWGREGQACVADDHPSVATDGARVSYLWSDELREWWINDGRGLEHGFTVLARPMGEGDLAIGLGVRGDLCADVRADRLGADFVDDRGEPALTYDGLVAFDADGRTLPARIESSGDALTIRVDDRLARYPLTIDPIAQQAYVKASNTGVGDGFGGSLAISGDTMVVGAPGEDGAATGVNGSQSGDDAPGAGAAYVFVRNGSGWTQQAYLKASNTEANDQFGKAVAIAGDTLVVGAPGEDGAAGGVDGDQSSNGASGAGAAYVFVRNGETWTQQAYLKASNPGQGDGFGISVGVSIDVWGDAIVVGAGGEDGAATGVNGDQSSNAATDAGAAYVFGRVGDVWAQEAYLKASNTDAADAFGQSVAISGGTVVVGAVGEDSSAVGVNGGPTGNVVESAGAAYVFVRGGGAWTQQAYLKASNTGTGDYFGVSVALDGDTMVVGAFFEDGAATGVDGDQSSNGASAAGAAYIFLRNGGTWSQQAYLKASNTDPTDFFGTSVAVEGDTVVVGAAGESSAATGVDGDQASDAATLAGAAYVFHRQGAAWTQQAYLKASNTDAYDDFGHDVAVDGDTMAVAADAEDGGSTGVGGDQSSDAASASGAVYCYGAVGWRAGDLDGDGHVNAIDLALLLGSWGGTQGGADLDGDGSVGASDLAVMLGAWTG